MFGSLSNPAILRLPQIMATPGQTLTVPVTIDARGDEEALSFSVHYSPAQLTNPRVELGSDTLALGFSLTVNPYFVANGKIGVLMDDSPTDAALPARTCHVANIIFDVLGGPSVGGLEFANDPIPLGGSDAMANNLVLLFQNGDVVLSGNAMPPVRPVSSVGYMGAYSGGGTTTTVHPVNPDAEPYSTEPEPANTGNTGTLPGTRPPVNPGHIEPDATIFGLSPLVVAAIAAVGLYFWSES